MNWLAFMMLFLSTVSIHCSSESRTAWRREIAAKAQIRSFEEVLALYYKDHGRYPTTGEGLNALQPYLPQPIPNDPWGHPYIYKFPGQVSWKSQ
jgi:type II secretory pathway pseudopilin PulG